MQERLNAWLTEMIGERLKPLVEIDAAQDIAGLARGIAFRLKENFGVLRRESVAEEIRSLDQPARAQLRKYGVRFGAFNIYFPTLLKPACSELAAVLWALKHGAEHGLDIAAMPELPRPGSPRSPPTPPRRRPSIGVAGFHVCGPRAVRVDMLERLADLIRPLLAWRADPANPGTPPKGATGDGGFKATPEMMSILGCSADELGNVLKALGFWAERRKVAPAVAAQPAPEAVAAPPRQWSQRPPTMRRRSSARSRRSPRRRQHLSRRQPSRSPRRSRRLPSSRASRRSSGPVAAAAAAADARRSRRAGRRQAEAAAEQWEEVWRPRRKGRAFEAGPERHKQQGQRPRHAHQGQGFRAQEPRADKPEPQPAPQQGNPSRPSRSRANRSRPRSGRKAAASGAAAVPASARSGRAFPCMPRRPSRKRRPSIPIHRSRR